MKKYCADPDIKRKNSFLDIPVLLALTLAAMNFYNGFYYILLCAFTLVVLKNIQSLRFNADFFILLSFSLAYLIFGLEDIVDASSFLKKFIFPIAYFIGCNVLKEKKQIFKYVIVLAYSVFAHSVITYFYNRNITGIGSNRNLYDVWTGQFLSATITAVMFTVIIGCMPYIFLSSKSKMLKLLAAVTLAVIVLYNMILAGRTVFIIMLVVFTFGIIYYCIKNKTKMTLKLLLFILLLCIALILMFHYNIGGIQTYISRSNFFARFTGGGIGFSEDSRLTNRMHYFTDMLNYLWGGNHLQVQYGYAHELFLDLYDEAGIIPYILLIIYSIRNLFSCISILKCRDCTADIKMLLIGIYLSFYLQFFAEPILAAIPWYFAIFCLINGMVSYYGMETRREMYEK